MYTTNGVQQRFGAFRLQPHQLAVSRLFAKPGIPGLLLYYKVGSGKTLASIAAAEHVLRVDRVPRRVVVVLPAPLKANYEKELRAAGVDAGRYTIYSYHALHNLSHAQQRALGRRAILVVDEVQNLRNPASKMYDSLVRVARRAHKRLLLSGTPVMNFPRDIGTVVGLLDPDRNVPRTVKVWVRVETTDDDGTIVEKIVPRYTFDNTYGRDASKNVAELDGMLRCTSLFYEPDPATVRQHYPTKTEHWVPVRMTPQQARLQFEMAMEEPGPAAIEELFEGNVNRFFLTKPREINSRLNDRHPKLDEVVRRVEEEHRRGGKSVVFSTYLHSGLYRIRQLLAARGVPSEVYEGATPAREKKRIVRDYNEDRVRVLLLSESGKEGLDLKNTTQMHVVEPQWNEEKVAQVIGRGVRYQSHTREPRHVDVYRYYSTLPPEADAFFHDYPSTSLLKRMGADEILMEITVRKNEVNTAFLQRLVRISDQNLRTCL